MVEEPATSPTKDGGIYTLPRHLSPGARDLIPRMLVVDPMKRVTIPEIRQHAWFQLQLPRYLDVPPPDTMQHAKKVEKCRKCFSSFLSCDMKVSFSNLRQLQSTSHLRVVSFWAPELRPPFDDDSPLFLFISSYSFSHRYNIFPALPISSLRGCLLTILL
ncbi:hypothetical protein ACFE04_007748 [Oxalis oulophora]